MATGYTYAIHDEDKEETFETFVMRVAKNFSSALRTNPKLWEDPSKKPAPCRANISYQLDAIEDARDTLEELQALSQDEIQKKAEESYQRIFRNWESQCEASIEIMARYEDMLEKVQAWSPPTSKHVDMKRFMIEQLETSIEHDCTLRDQPPKMSPQEWYQCHSELATDQIKRAKKRMSNIINNVKDQNDWLEELWNSLPDPECP